MFKIKFKNKIKLGQNKRKKLIKLEIEFKIRFKNKIKCS